MKMYHLDDEEDNIEKDYNYYVAKICIVITSMIMGLIAIGLMSMKAI